MLRILLVLSGLIFAQPGLAQEAGSSGRVNQNLDVVEEQVWEMLRLPDLLPIIRDEAMAEAGTMQQTIFERGGDGRWFDIVEKLHQPKRLEAILRHNMSKTLQTVPRRLIDEALAFYETDLGRRMIASENMTRRDMLDAAVEEDALAAFAEAASHQKNRAEQIKEIIYRSDLIE